MTALWRKARSLLCSPRKAIRGKIKSRARYLGKIRLGQEGLLGLLEQRPSNALRPDYDDLWRLYRNISSRKPSQVIEFGSGCSTLIIGEALRRNGLGKLLTLETDRHWADSIAAELPWFLRSIVTVKLCTVEPVPHWKDRMWRLAGVPYMPVDFIYLDGPYWGQFPDIKQLGITVDPVLMERNFKPGFSMLVDYRKNTVAWLRKHLTRDYRVKTSRTFEYSQFTLKGA